MNKRIMLTGRTNTRAFTLVEVLVVVGIIGVLISLLLPAVQAARETARRVGCTSNLAQHIIAVQNYETFHQVYPPGTVDSKGPILNRPVGYHHNWIVQLLPFLEREAVAHHIDRQVGVYHKNNVPVRRLAVRFFNCPSDQRLDGYTNYAAVHHDVEAPIDVDNNGVFFLNSRIGRHDVTDGLSHTLFLGEKLCEPGDLGWMSGTRATLRNTGEPINRARQLRVTIRGGFNASSLPGLPSGLESEDLARGIDIYSSDEPDSALTIRRGGAFVGGFSSYHPTGANFAYGDGSIRWLANNLSTRVLQQLGHRRDGQLPEHE